MVFLELVKAGFQLFYFREKNECDFIVKSQKQILPVQVAWEVGNDDTRTRELKGLAEACRMINTKYGIIVTFDTKETLEFDGIKVDMIPVYEFCARGIVI
jgi:predicted AAA+ superfamily ATPase